MLTLVWISPVVLFVALMVSRRLSPLASAALSLTVLMIIVIAAGPVPLTGDEALLAIAGGAWIGLPAVVVILAGLFFTEVLPHQAVDSAGTSNDAMNIGTVCLFIGPFVETATGFGIGYVVALQGLRSCGVSTGRALALAGFSQCLVPWGALGVGTGISAALISQPVMALQSFASLIVFPILILMAPLFWRLLEGGGIPVSVRQMIADLCLLAAMAGLLVGTSRVLPIELAGMAAIGPVLLVRLWLQSGMSFLSRPALRRAMPYLALIGFLAITGLVQPVRGILAGPAFSPGAGAPLFAPLLSPAVPLFLIATVTSLVFWGRDGTLSALGSTAQKGWRASILTFVLVALAWLLVRSGIAGEVASLVQNSIGKSATILVPLLGGLGGYLTGSNTGAGGLSMPIAATMLDDRFQLIAISASAVVVGSLLTAVSPIRMGMGQALTEASDLNVTTALRLLLPYTLLVVLVGCAVVFLV